MAIYSIGIFDFIRWEGQPPPLVKQHVIPFNKIGQNGISAQNVGRFGDPFEAVLSAAFINKASATVVDETYRDLIGANPVEIEYDGLNYLFTFAHTYLVLAVDTLRIKRMPLLLGPGYSFPGGYLVQTRWQMIPITTS